MTARVLLVTGSRALSATPQAEAWARAELVKRITLAVGVSSRRHYRPLNNWTKGPTEWVEEMASDSIVVTRWSLRGSVDYRIAGRMTAGWWWLSGSAKPPPTWHDLRYARDAACMAQTATTLDASVLFSTRHGGAITTPNTRCASRGGTVSRRGARVPRGVRAEVDDERSDQSVAGLVSRRRVCPRCWTRKRMPRGNRRARAGPVR